MTDIVERLRATQTKDALYLEAADEIERLRARYNELRGDTLLTAAIARVHELVDEANEQSRLLKAGADEIVRLRKMLHDRDVSLLKLGNERWESNDIRERP